MKTELSFISFTNSTHVFKFYCGRPWPGGSVGWTNVPYTKRLRVRFSVRAHDQVAGLITVGACMGGNRSMSLSLSLSLPLSLKSIIKINVSLGED